MAKMLGPCGSTNGSEKKMDTNLISRIVKISVRHGASVDALTVRYIRNGVEESTEQWGGNGGSLTEFDLGPAEYITSVKGHYGSDMVRSITFETNLGAYGPYGKEEGIPFELPAVAGKIIGFHALSGSYLYAIGVYVEVVGTIGSASTGNE
ncbi:Mannose-binding lectin superfamily protein [Rhynchospora pubera]|uniref:Mannose-binding lectin superfamily protein n=1 Tax=Rhynchospora pubera TaxID=906938 RepID=A0AAV8EEY5_9POAL|nr:Mannose-binding lectin superfamily protein [Rhynchospora pubera]KAJ4785874.1 Mannose-binding lectin superfamily protein [Rhynchospora pubera]